MWDLSKTSWHRLKAAVFSPLPLLKTNRSNRLGQMVGEMTREEWTMQWSSVAGNFPQICPSEREKDLPLSEGLLWFEREDVMVETTAGFPYSHSRENPAR